MEASRRVVVVTGAAKRVGRATALALAEVGCDLVLHYRSSTREVEATRRDAIELARGTGHAISVQTIEGDLAEVAGIERLAGRLCDAVGANLAGLVHNASSYGPSRFGSIRPADALGHFHVNALAPLLLTQALADALRAAHGAVVIMSDIHAMGRPRKSFAPYLMSKAAVTSLVETLALECAPEVRVNGVAPGVVAWPEHADPNEVASYEARIPLGRAGTPEEAARVIRWLLLEASYVSGEVVRVDGGRALR